MNFSQVIFWVIVFLLSLLVMYGNVRVERMRKEKLGKRPVIDFDSWLEQNGYDQTETFKEAAQIVLDQLADALEIQPTQLRSLDRFTEELALEWHWYLMGEDNLYFVGEMIEKDLHRRLGYPVEIDAESKTVDDVIRDVASLISQ